MFKMFFRRILFTVSALFICYTSSSVAGPPVGTTFSFLSGTWKMSITENGQEGGLYETWHFVNDSLWQGRSYVVFGKDTTPTETIRLIQRGPDVFYIPQVQTQNDGLPVEFIYRGFVDGGHMFENEAHDFPQRIYYAPVLPDSLNARIEGTVRGKLQMEKFSYVKAR